MLPIITALLLAATPTEPLDCASPRADLGDARTGPPLSHTFRLSNKGTGTIIITGLEAGCGCVRRDLTRDTLKPGESTDLTMTVNTLTPPPGRNTWAVTVRYREKVEHSLELSMSANLIREVSVTPAALAFSTEGAARQTVVVADIRSKPLTVRSAISTSPHLTAEVRGVVATDGSRTQNIDVVLAADTPNGEHDEVLTLTTDDPTCPVLRVPVRITKRAPDAVRATPEAIQLRFSADQTVLSSLVHIRASGRRVEVRKVKCDQPGVTATWSNNGLVATMRVTVKPDAKTTGQGIVRVELAEPAGVRVEIPVAWSGE